MIFHFFTNWCTSRDLNPGSDLGRVESYQAGPEVLLIIRELSTQNLHHVFSEGPERSSFAHAKIFDYYRKMFLEICIKATFNRIEIL